MTGARRAITIGLAAATFLLVALAAGADVVPLAVEGSGGWFVEPLRSDDGSDADTSDQDGDNNESEDERPTATAASAILELAAFVSVVILCLLLGRAMLRRTQKTSEVRRARRASSSSPGAPTPELADAVEEGLATLESGPVDDAIVACWVRLEEAAAGAGVARLPSETATELTVRLLTRFDVPEQAVTGLLELYRAARYSRHHLGEDDRAAALAALQAIGLALERAPA